MLCLHTLDDVFGGAGIDGEDVCNKFWFLRTFKTNFLSIIL